MRFTFRASLHAGLAADAGSCYEMKLIIKSSVVAGRSNKAAACAGMPETAYGAKSRRAID
jgi:hypothetical protein